MNPFARIAALEERINKLETEKADLGATRETLEAHQTAIAAQGQTIQSAMNSLAAQGEMLSGLAERVQEIEVPKRPRTHFSGLRAPEVKA